MTADSPMKDNTLKNGDEIDRAIHAFHLLKGSEMFVKITTGNYSFGSKKLQAKLSNNKLLIRVGGGFMSAEEFWEAYYE